MGSASRSPLRLCGGPELGAGQEPPETTIGRAPPGFAEMGPPVWMPVPPGRTVLSSRTTPCWRSPTDTYWLPACAKRAPFKKVAAIVAIRVRRRSAACCSSGRRRCGVVWLAECERLIRMRSNPAAPCRRVCHRRSVRVPSHRNRRGSARWISMTSPVRMVGTGYRRSDGGGRGRRRVDGCWVSAGGTVRCLQARCLIRVWP
jgi:hypothetical protein